MNSTASNRPRGWWYPYIFVAMFMVVIAVNGALFYFATSTFTGLTSGHAYEEGLHYNKALAQEETQEKLGWKVTAKAQILNKDEHQAELQATFLDKDGKPVQGLEVTGFVDRPTQVGFMRKLALQAQVDGAYVSTFIAPVPGNWEFQVVARRDGVVIYQIGEKIILP